MRAAYAVCSDMYGVLCLVFVLFEDELYEINCLYNELLLVILSYHITYLLLLKSGNLKRFFNFIFFFSLDGNVQRLFLNIVQFWILRYQAFWHLWSIFQLSFSIPFYFLFVFCHWYIWTQGEDINLKNTININHRRS